MMDQHKHKCPNCGQYYICCDDECSGMFKQCIPLLSRRCKRCIDRPRFSLIENDPGFPDTSGSPGGSRWWRDTARPIKEVGIGYMAVEIPADKDPNYFVRIEADQFDIIFQDQCEYYFVCSQCYASNERLQWAGSTKGPMGWREKANAQLQKHIREKGWCEFCDPVFGNGGFIR